MRLSWWLLVGLLAGCTLLLAEQPLAVRAFEEDDDLDFEGDDDEAAEPAAGELASDDEVGAAS